MSEKKAFVVTVVGAGGKSAYLRRRALEYVDAGMKTAVTTTTHIWRPEEKDCGGTEVYENNKKNTVMVYHGTDGVDTIGVPMNDGRLSAPPYETFRKICARYDTVLVEGDGSHCMPVKIPGDGEPVIADGTGEIAVVMGRQAVGRRLDIVCHRYDRERLEQTGILPQSTDGKTDLTVTDQILEQIAEEFYIKPLHERYPEAKLIYVPSPYSEKQTGRTDTTASQSREGLCSAEEPLSAGCGITAVLMASGFGRRYGGNKLMDLFEGKELYRHAAEHIIKAFGKESVLVVTQYDEIMTQTREMGIRSVKNMDAAEGISASIRIGTKYAIARAAAQPGSDKACQDPVVIFFAADMPYLSPEEIIRYVRQFLWSGKTFGCMEYGSGHILTNPGAFRMLRVPSPLAGERPETMTVSDMLLGLTGDSGAMRIMKRFPHEIYRYQVPHEAVADIDVRSQARLLL